MNRSRVLGALLGAACGDALGATLEFSPPRTPRPGRWLRGPHTTITGGGAFRVAPGQVTDDTQMAVALARSLQERGRFEAAAVGRAYLTWSCTAFDIGNQTRAALKLIDGGVVATLAGQRAWEESGRFAAGNGSLMRCTPLAVFHPHAPAKLLRSALADAAITHGNPACMLAGAAYTAAIAYCITSELATPAGALASARHALKCGAELLCGAMNWRRHADTVRDAEDVVGAVLTTSWNLDDEARYAAPVLHALYLAFRHLRAQSRYRAAVIDAANRGGDADTNAAIVGGLLGAHCGLGGVAGVPRDWEALVCGWTPDRIDQDGDRYHPRFLAAFAAHCMGRAGEVTVPSDNRKRKALGT